MFSNSKNELRFTFVLFSLFFLMVANLAEGKGYGAEVWSTSPRLLETEPGRIISGTFLVSNNMEREVEFEEKLELPPDWLSITSDEFLFRLKPKRKQVRVVAFRIPVTSPAGRYRIPYTVRERSYGRQLDTVADSDTLTVIVLQEVKIDLLIETTPKAVIAGESYVVRLRLVNRGNAESQIKMDAEGGGEYPVGIKPRESFLEAGESQIIECKAETGENLKKVMTYRIKVTARTVGSGKDVVSVSRTVAVEVIPRVTGDVDSYHRVPTKLQIFGGGEEASDAFQVAFSGSGSLDESSTRRIEFAFRGPDIQEKTPYIGSRDELWFGFHDRILDVYAGDRGYSLSPLTERFRYGRGAEVRINHANLGIESFYLQSRWEKPKRREFGSSVECHLSDEFLLKGNMLNKTGEFNDLISSIQTRIKPNEGMDLQLEYGLSYRKGGKPLCDDAYRLNSDGELPGRLRYSVERVHAGSNYFGYFNDSDYMSGAITFPLPYKANGHLFYYSSSGNLELNPEKGTARRESQYRAGISHTFPFNTTFSLDYQDVFKKDQLLTSGYHDRERFLKVGMGKGMNKLNLQTYIERGKHEEKFPEFGKEDLTRYIVYSDFRPSAGQTYSLYGRFGHKSLSGMNEKVTNLGISGTWQFQKSLHLRLSYQKNKLYAEGRRESDQIISTLTYTLPNSHSLTMRNQWFLQSGNVDGENAFFLSYTIPWNIPSSRKKGIGTLRGRVYNAEMPGSPPLADIILKANGMTAVTDRYGEFKFPSLEPGMYYLQLENSSLDVGQVTVERMPMMVKVAGGETTELRIGVVTACTITGTVSIFPPDSEVGGGIVSDKPVIVGSGEKDRTATGGVQPEGSRGVPLVLVEISNEKKTIREFTDGKGKYSFVGIRPGSWLLRAYDDNLPPYHYLDQKEFPVKLKPGEEKDVVIRVLPRLRSIRIIDGGEIR